MKVQCIGTCKVLIVGPWCTVSARETQFLAIILIKGKEVPSPINAMERGEVLEALSHRKNLPCEGRLERYCVSVES